MLEIENASMSETMKKAEDIIRIKTEYETKADPNANIDALHCLFIHEPC